MRLKAEMGEGKARAQKLTTEDGELVEGVKSLNWKAEAAEAPILVVELYAAKVDFDLGNAPETETP